MYYPNQKTITINREKVEKVNANGRLYLVAFQDNLCAAMKNLSHSTFKVYTCLLFNKDLFSIEYSPAFISQLSGIHPDTARRAFRELEEKGYINQIDNHSFVFYEVPRQSYKVKPLLEKRQFIDDDTGEIVLLTYQELVDAIGENGALSMWREAVKDESETENK